MKPRSPNLDPELHPVDGARTLVEDFGELADEMRQIAVDVGLHPYRVFAVRITWSGDRVGSGEPRVTLEEEFLPTPRVDLAGLRRESREPGGYVERGTIRMDRVSPRYTEDQIATLCPKGGSLPPNVEAFIEVRMDSRDPNAIRRRFVLADPPVRRADRFDWLVRLLPQDDHRERSGAPTLAPRTVLERDFERFGRER